MNTLDHDAIDRTLLMSLHDGTQPTLEAALAAKGRFGVRITCAGHTDTASIAATLTAVTLAVRIAGVVVVTLPDPERVVPTGPARGSTLDAAISAAGAHPANADSDDSPHVEQWVTLNIGNPETVNGTAASAGASLWVGWDGWRARVSTDRTPVTGGNVLAAIAAAAIAVHEAFGIFKNQPGRDDGYRDFELDLWTPDGQPSGVARPDLAWAPNRWWLVGLGHLGQASAWVLAWLLSGATEAEIVLQDDATISPANHSTGVFATATDVGQRKTRLAARHLEASGLRTRIIEQRFDAAVPIPPQQRHHVALFGVDDLAVRRTISDGHFELALDAGLGTEPTTYDSILIHRFPGSARSTDIQSWREGSTPTAIPNTAAFTDLQQRYEICGITELAGTAVGAAFVGVTAAVLTITEALRANNEGSSHSPLRLDLATAGVSAAPLPTVQEPPAIRLQA